MSDEELKNKVERIHRLLFDDDNPEQRSIYDDLVLLRLVYNRFKSARFVFGLVIGVLVVGVPLIYGVAQLVVLIKSIFHH